MTAVVVPEGLPRAGPPTEPFGAEGEARRQRQPERPAPAAPPVHAGAGRSHRASQPSRGRPVVAPVDLHRAGAGPGGVGDPAPLRSSAQPTPADPSPRDPPRSGRRRPATAGKPGSTATVGRAGVDPRSGVHTRSPTPGPQARTPSPAKGRENAVSGATAGARSAAPLPGGDDHHRPPAGGPDDGQPPEPAARPGFAPRRHGPGRRPDGPPGTDAPLEGTVPSPFTLYRQRPGRNSGATGRRRFDLRSRSWYHPYGSASRPSRGVAGGIHPFSRRGRTDVFRPLGVRHRADRPPPPR